MAIEHEDIVNSELHELKGASLALANQVPVADGAGNSTWGFIGGTATIPVNSKSDLPAPIAGVITLGAGLTYLINGTIDIGTDRLVFSLNTKVAGYNRFTDGLSYTGTSPMLTATVTHSIDEMFLSCANSDALALSGAGAETAVYTNSFVVTCKRVGNITGWRTTVWRSFSVVSATDVTNGRVLFTGACSSFNQDNSRWSGFVAGEMIDLGTATFDRIQLNGGNRYVVDSGNTGIKGAASCANLNTPDGRGIISGGIFEGAGTFLSGIAKGDVCWTLNSLGIPRSEKDVDIYMHANATGTSASTTPAKVAGTWAGDEANQFTSDATGRMTYIGKDDTGFSVNSTIFAAATSGSSQRYYFYIAKNGTIVTSSKSTRDFTTSTPGSLSVTAHVDMAENDYLELFVEKETGSDTITVIDEHTVVSQVT